MQRKVKFISEGYNTQDGAGVKLTRVLSLRTTKLFDPFLMLDAFDSINPKDYLAGFPMHPHRGIETITYLVEGEIAHQDSLGNNGSITSGSAQWMTAGSGILHQEMPKPQNRLLGVQLWLNLSQKEKMTVPKYFDIQKDMISQVETEFGAVRILSGNWQDHHGVTPHHLQATIIDFSLNKNQTLNLSTKSNETTFIFTLLGDVIIDHKTYREKTALLFDEGDTLTISSKEDQPSRFLFFQAPALKEPIAWGGPIVMNTNEELNKAYEDLQRGTFIK